MLVYVYNKDMKSGFSLVEVLIFVSILSLFFVVVAATTMSSLRTTKINERKILASRYAQEAVAWLKGQKETNWSSFVVYSAPTGTTYCFNTTPIAAWPSSGSCAAFGGLDPALYKREVTLTSIDCSGTICQVNVAVAVQWQELEKTYNVPLNTIFSIWE